MLVDPNAFPNAAKAKLSQYCRNICTVHLLYGRSPEPASFETLVVVAFNVVPPSE